MATIKTHTLKNFYELCETVITNANSGQYFDFMRFPEVIRTGCNILSPQPYVDITTFKMKPTEPQFKPTLTGKPFVMDKKQFLNLIQLTGLTKLSDYNILSLGKAGFVTFILNTKPPYATPKPPQPAAKKLTLVTDWPKTGAVGDKLKLEWSDGKSPFNVTVTDDSGAKIVDNVDLKAVTSYEFDTTSHPAAKYKAVVTDANSDSITSTETDVS